MEKSKKRSKGIRIAISVIAALALWVYMEVEQPIDVTMDVRNIPVEFSNEDTTLADRGLMLLSGYDASVDLELEGSRGVLWKLNKDEVRIVVNTNSITSAGTQALKYDVAFPDEIPPNAITVKDASAWSVTVKVGELYTKEVPIEVDIRGDVPEGYFTEDMLIDPAVLVLRAPREDLLNVSKAKVTLNIGSATSTLIETLEYTLYDYNDIPVENEAIRASTKLIQVTLPIRTSKEVPLRVELIGAEEYSESVHVSIKPEKVRIKGEADTIAGIRAITLDKIYVEDLVTGLNGPYSYTIKTPAGVSTMDGVTEAVVTVAVNGTTEGTVLVEKVNCEGVADGLRAIVNDPLLITLWGTEEAVANITPEQVLVRVDASEITEAGTYELPAVITLQDAGGVSVRGEYTVTVLVAERTVPPAENGGETTEPSTPDTPATTPET